MVEPHPHTGMVGPTGISAPASVEYLLIGISRGYQRDVRAGITNIKHNHNTYVHVDRAGGGALLDMVDSPGVQVWLH